MAEQTDPINENPDQEQPAGTGPLLDGIEQRGNGFVVSFQVPAGTTGAAVEMDAAHLGVLPGSIISVTPANATSAALLPYGFIEADEHMAVFGTGAPSTNGALVTVMVTR
ncbi:hypothetical protein AB0D63_43265 [Kitasatospora sp. NPDC048343]|uniref:hypothetical protein n=1 Tax=Kitasatospora sp. NPDC048343 TaxID=3154717 RepID=UPI0033CD69EE